MLIVLVFLSSNKFQHEGHKDNNTRCKLTTREKPLWTSICSKTICILLHNEPIAQVDLIHQVLMPYPLHMLGYIYEMYVEKMVFSIQVLWGWHTTPMQVDSPKFFGWHTSPPCNIHNHLLKCWLGCAFK